MKRLPILVLLLLPTILLGQASYNIVTVPFSLFPNFVTGNGSTLFNFTLTGNVISSSLNGGSLGMEIIFNICQDGVGNHSFPWPPNVNNPPPVLQAANACTIAKFINNGGFNWVPSGTNSLNSAAATTGTFTNLTVSGTGTTTAAVRTLYSRDCRADGTIDTTGVADSSATINTCIANAVTNQQSNIELPCGKLLLNSALNLTNRPGLRLKGCSNQLQISSQNPIAAVGVTILLCNSGTVCIDTTGSGDIQVKDLELYLAGNGISTPTPIGVLQGRDNNGGGGAGNPFCFAERQVYDNIAVIDFTGGGLNTTANGSRGYIGFYNVAAEQDRYSDVWIYSATNMVFADTNVLSVTSPYQTLSTGCPATMNTATLSNMFLDSQSTITQNHIENTNGINFTWTGLVMLGGGGGIKFGGASQATTGWHVFGDYEQVNATTYYIITSVNLLDCIFRSAAANMTAMVNPTANNLSFFNDQFLFMQTTTPFATNTSTGTVVSGGTISTAATNTLSNVKLIGTLVQAPQVAHTTQTFASGSIYNIYANDGTFQVGPFVSTGPIIASAAGSAGGFTQPDLVAARTAATGVIFIGSNGSDFLDFGVNNGANFTFTGGNVVATQNFITNGTACTNGELALSAGWQSTGSATVTAVAGKGQTCSWTITTGTTTAANPTVTDTLTNALITATTVCEMNIHGGTHTAAAGEGFQQTTLSATAPVFTFNGTPTAGGTTYFVTRRCGP